MIPPDPPYLVLSRDGVLDDPEQAPPSRPERWQPLPGSLEALARLCRQGRRLLLTSSPRARIAGSRAAGMEWLYAMDLELCQRLRTLVPGGGVDAVFFCACKPGARDCLCAQPEIQCFPEIARRIGREDLRGIPAVANLGISAVAAQAAGADPVHLVSGRGSAELERGAVPTGVPVYQDLGAYAERLEVS